MFLIDCSPMSAKATGSLSPTLVAHRARDADAAGSASVSSRAATLTPSPNRLPSLDQHVAEIDADAEAHPPRRRARPRSLASIAVLHLDRAAHRVDHAGELGQHAVARGADDAAAVARDQPVHHRAARRERAQRRLLVDAHQARVALDIGGEDRGELAFGFGRGGPRVPYGSTTASASAAQTARWGERGDTGSPPERPHGPFRQPADQVAGPTHSASSFRGELPEC